MKKIFMLVLTLFFSLSLFAETGYHGVEWYTHIDTVVRELWLKKPSYMSNPRFIETMEEDDIQEPPEYITQKNILGTPTDISYYFGLPPLEKVKILSPEQNDFRGVTSISYIIPTEKKRQLVSKYKKPVQKLFMKDGKDICTISTEILEEGLKEGFSKEVLIELMDATARILCSQTSNDIEKHGAEASNAQLKPSPTSTPLTIYDYNDDTRVYIYDNIIKDKAVVVYVPHEQDY